MCVWCVSRHLSVCAGKKKGGGGPSPTPRSEICRPKLADSGHIDLGHLMQGGISDKPVMSVSLAASRGASRRAMREVRGARNEVGRQLCNPALMHGIALLGTIPRRHSAP